MADFLIKRNDTKPVLDVALQSDGSQVDLSGASVQLHLQDDSGTVVLDTAMTITNASTGAVEYQWQAADTATAGKFQAECEVTYSDGAIETFPLDGSLDIVITEDLA